MLVPLVAIDRAFLDEELSPAISRAGLLSAKDMVSSFTGNAAGVLQALKALFPRIPAGDRRLWLEAVHKACEASVRALSLSSRFSLPLLRYAFAQPFSLRPR